MHNMSIWTDNDAIKIIIDFSTIKPSHLVFKTLSVDKQQLFLHAYTQMLSH